MNHAQNARQALSEGIIAGAVDHVQQAELPKLSSAICDALVNRREDINQAYRGTGDTERARALGFVVAGILTMPQIKIGDRRKPTNVQLVQEVTNQVLCEDNNLEISVALGGSEQPPSLRLVSYVSPMLEIGSLFARQHLPVPTLRVVAAHAVSSTLNGLDAKRAHERANQATTIIDRLVEMYYPECRSSVVFEHLEVDELQEKGHDKDTAYLLEILEGEDDSPTEVTSSLVKLLARATKRHASGRDAQEHASVLAGYGAAHGLSFHNYRYPSVTSAIKIG